MNRVQSHLNELESRFLKWGLKTAVRTIFMKIKDKTQLGT
jgi:hypothetical protein